MSTRKIVGFNDEIEFEVVNDKIRIIDNGPLYKNKLKNGLFLDTLCEMDIQYEDVICDQLVEEIKCVKFNYEIDEISDEISEQIVNKRQRQNGKRQYKREQNKKKINEKEKKRRDKRKILKTGNDYKMNQYCDDVVRKVVIPTNHFGKNEVDKYAPLCTDCFVFAMLTKRYYMLYKCSYQRICCPHKKCWMCSDSYTIALNGNKFCNLGCYDNWRNFAMIRYTRRSCHCGEEYGYDYGKKYKCGTTYYGFDFNTHINYRHYLEQNGNIIIEIKDHDVNFEPILNVDRDDYDYDYDDDYEDDYEDDYYSDYLNDYYSD
jgi:hypothetical protein